MKSSTTTRQQNVSIYKVFFTYLILDQFVPIITKLTVRITWMMNDGISLTLSSVLDHFDSNIDALQFFVAFRIILVTHQLCLFEFPPLANTP